MNIAQKVKELGLPDGEFVVIGSGSLQAAGLIADSSDIDLAVSPQVYEALRRQDWQQYAGHGGKPVLRRDVFDVGVGYGEWSLEELLEDAFMVDGIPFMSLERLLIWKKFAARGKDQAHIKLIEQYFHGRQ